MCFDLHFKITKITTSANTINPATVGSTIVRILFFSAGCDSTDKRIKLIRQDTMVYLLRVLGTENLMTLSIGIW